MARTGERLVSGLVVAGTLLAGSAACGSEGPATVPQDVVVEYFVPPMHRAEASIRPVTDQQKREAGLAALALRGRPDPKAASRALEQDCTAADYASAPLLPDGITRLAVELGNLGHSATAVKVVYALDAQGTFTGRSLLFGTGADGEHTQYYVADRLAGDIVNGQDDGNGVWLEADYVDSGTGISYTSVGHDGASTDQEIIAVKPLPTAGTILVRRLTCPFGR